jgi:hypothetical protein
VATEDLIQKTRDKALAAAAEKKKALAAAAEKERAPAPSSAPADEKPATTKGKK